LSICATNLGVQGGVTARKNRLEKLAAPVLVYQNCPATRELVLSETHVARLVLARMGKALAAHCR